MRIAFLTHQWPGARMGGIGSAIRQTAAALAQAGHEVHVFTLTLPADSRANIPSGVIVHETPSLAERVQAGTLPANLAATISAGGEGMYRLATGWLLCAELLQHHRQQPFDVAETPEVEALGLPLMLDADLDLPVIAHLHCCTAIAHLGNDAPIGPDDHLIRALEFATIALADGRCAPTQRVVELTRQFMALPDDVAIIPHPVFCDGPANTRLGETPPAALPWSDPATAPVSQKPQPSGHGLGEDAAPDAAGLNTPDVHDGALLFFGRIERLKGVETIARALNTFLPRNPDARFRFVGPDTPTAPGGRSMIEHLKRMIDPALHARVIFAGEADRGQIGRELHGCLFCVLPSLWENFSMACCEAMAAGRAVIVGAGTGSVELIGEAGIVARRDDAEDLARQMERLYRDAALRQQLASRAQARIADAFAPAAVAEQRRAFYIRVIEQIRRAHRPNLAELVDRLPPDSHAALLRAMVLTTSALTGCGGQPPRTPGAHLLRIMIDLQRQRGTPAQVVLYGAGKHTTRLLSERALWESRGHRVIGLLDDHPRFADNPRFLDLPVRSIAQAVAEAGREHPPVVLSTDTYQDQFWQQTEPLRALGVPVYRLYDI